MTALAQTECQQQSNRQLVVCHQTAALYWRAVKEGRLPHPQPLDLRQVPASCIHGYHDASCIDLSPLGIGLHPDGITSNLLMETTGFGAWGRTERRRVFVPQGIALPNAGTAPLHLLVSQRAQRSHQRGIVTHLLARSVPPESFYRVSDSLVVSSPELTCLQMMNSQRVLPCLELLCEWCGTYALGPWGSDCLFSRPPLTDLDRLHAFVTRAKGLHGIAGTRRVLELASERLASPRETELYLMLALPVSLGGLGLPKPFVNQRIPLQSMQLVDLSEHGCFEADLLWPHVRLIVEYDGIDEHEQTAQQVAADKERRSVLAALGYTVIVVTKRDLTSMQAFERKARQIAAALGVRLPHLGLEEHVARERLFGWLFDPMHEHVPFGSGY